VTRTADSLARRLLKIAVEDDTYEDVLAALSKGIKECAERADMGDEDAEFECIKVEMLLGTAYVVCQAKITAVVEAAARVNGWDREQSAERAQLRATGPRTLGYTKVEMLWALGNYFKHRDQWAVGEWANPNRSNRKTIEVLTAMGLRETSDANLRDGAETLGNNSFSDMEFFQHIIDDWTKLV
jgi:hypothetical protein